MQHGANVIERTLFSECTPPYDFARCLRCSTDRALVPSYEALPAFYCFAEAWSSLATAGGADPVLSVDCAAALAFSGVMLSHNLHGDGVGSRMVSRERFVEGCRRLDDDGAGVPEEVSGALYDNVAEKPLAVSLPSPLSTAKMAELDAQPIAKQGWLMMKQLDSELGDAAPWCRCWARIYEQDAAMFITPQQWGVDGEIVVRLPLDGLVVTSMGEGPSAQPVSFAHHADQTVEDALSTTASCNDTTPHVARNCDAHVHASDSRPTPSHQGDEGSEGDKYGKASFILLMGSSQLRKNLPRLLVSANGDADLTSEWAEAFIRRIQLLRFRSNLQNAFQENTSTANPQGVCERDSTCARERVCVFVSLLCVRMCV
jgi:hypothetical protein